MESMQIYSPGGSCSVAPEGTLAMMQHPELVQSLRQSGHRLTPRHEIVLTVVAESDGHLTAEEILARAQAVPVSQQVRRIPFPRPVNRTQSRQSTDLGHGHVEYELHRHPHHHHLICRHCKGVQQIDHAPF